MLVQHALLHVLYKLITIKKHSLLLLQWFFLLSFYFLLSPNKQKYNKSNAYQYEFTKSSNPADIVHAELALITDIAEIKYHHS
jgi:hypothetical protein